MSICVCSSDEADSVAQDIVLITGSGSGLGRLMALEFAKLGSTLVLWDVDEAAIKKGLFSDSSYTSLALLVFNW